MTPWVHHILASALTTAIEILPEPGEQLSLRQAWSMLRGRYSTLDYAISQQELSHIFRLNSSAYAGDENERSFEIRQQAGHFYTGPHQEVHSSGDTRVLHTETFSIYINMVTSGVFSSTGEVWDHARNVVAHVQNTAKNLPRAIANLDKLQAVVTHAHKYESPGALCQLSVVAHNPVLSRESMGVTFIMRAEYMTDYLQGSPVFIRYIERPVLLENGQVQYGVKIKPHQANSHEDTVRFLIFAKQVMNQAISKQPVDIERILSDIATLNVQPSSRLKDFLGYQPHP